MVPLPESSRVFHLPRIEHEGVDEPPLPARTVVLKDTEHRAWRPQGRGPDGPEDSLVKKPVCPSAF